MNFIQVLNSKRGRSIVESLESGYLCDQDILKAKTILKREFHYNYVAI